MSKHERSQFVNPHPAALSVQRKLDGQSEYNTLFLGLDPGRHRGGYEPRHETHTFEGRGIREVLKEQWWVNRGFDRPVGRHRVEDEEIDRVASFYRVGAVIPGDPPHVAYARIRETHRRPITGITTDGRTF